MTRVLETTATFARRVLLTTACLALISVVAVGCGVKGNPVKPQPQSETPETEAQPNGAPQSRLQHGAPSSRAG